MQWAPGPHCALGINFSAPSGTMFSCLGSRTCRVWAVVLVAAKQQHQVSFILLLASGSISNVIVCNAVAVRWGLQNQTLDPGVSRRMQVSKQNTH
jgi:hypothetical protein